MWRTLTLIAIVAVAGCGPSAHELRERTLSTMNLEADRWNGDKAFATTAHDAYGQPLSATVTRGPLNHTLELRSSGPDRLAKNSDDIVVTRTKPHGESTLTDEAAKAAEAIAGGAASGTIKGIKKGLGFGDAAKK